MALYTELPVYKLGYDLLIEVYNRTKVFSREYKYTLGERLKNETTQMLINIYLANKSKMEIKIEHIDGARENVEIIRLLFRVCKDLNVMSLKGYVAINAKVEELSKQLAAWHKYTAGVQPKT